MNPEGDTTPVDPTAATGITVLKCGQPFQPPSAGPLRLTGRFPTTVPASERTVTGTVEVSSWMAVRGVTTPRADVFLIRDGRVVTMPLPQDAVGILVDLGPEKTRHLPGEATLMSCGPGSEPVPPGTYQVYARVTLTQDDSTSVASFGGPWPLDVR